MSIETVVVSTERKREREREINRDGGRADKKEEGLFCFFEWWNVSLCPDAASPDLTLLRLSERYKLTRLNALGRGRGRGRGGGGS